jgi:hypothetical protein
MVKHEQIHGHSWLELKHELRDQIEDQLGHYLWNRADHTLWEPLWGLLAEGLADHLSHSLKSQPYEET